MDTPRQDPSLSSIPTFQPAAPVPDPRGEPVSRLAVTILYHADLSRVGERMCEPLLGGRIELGRGSRFRAPGSAERDRSLRDPGISRTCCVLELDRSGALAVASGGARLLARRAGELRPVSQLTPHDIAEGLALVELPERALFRVHLVDGAPAERDDLGMLGMSDAMARLRRSVRRYAPLLAPGRSPPAAVLIRGESGAGKELVAAALSRLSGGRTFVPVNIAGLSDDLASSQLFGHKKGAFSGATQDSRGLFGDAADGALFLDEIGACSARIQADLLRAVGNGEILPVGGRVSKSRAALIFATDADLEAKVESGEFSHALFQRLKPLSITVPPLRDRREDIPALLYRFLRESLPEAEADRLLRDQEQRRPWLSLDAIRYLVTYDWPGNIRELRGLAMKLAIELRGQPQVALGDVKRLLGRAQEPARLAVPAPRPGGAESYETVFEENLYIIERTADALGIAQNTFRKWLKDHPTLKRPSDLTEAEIEQARGEVGDDLARLARRLRVSEHGLKQRMSKLGLDPAG